MTDITIRPATIFDQTNVMICLAEWLNDNAVPYPTFDHAFAHWVCNTLTRGVCFVAEHDSQIVGIIGGNISKFPWNSQEPFLAVEWFYVNANFRKGNVANKLIEKLKEAIEQYNLPIVTTLMNGVDTESKERFMCMKGFTYTGGSFYFKGE
jgi:hypothetical protein